MALKADALLLLCGVALGLPAAAAAADGERYDPQRARSPPTRTTTTWRRCCERVASSWPSRCSSRTCRSSTPLPLSARASASQAPGVLPEGWVQIGEVVQRREVAEGRKQIDPKPLPAWEDIEGNQYPRKGTVFLNFNGGKLKSGDDNSAEKQGRCWPTRPQVPGVQRLGGDRAVADPGGRAGPRDARRAACSTSRARARRCRTRWRWSAARGPTPTSATRPAASPPAPTTRTATSATWSTRSTAARRRSARRSPTPGASTTRSAAIASVSYQAGNNSNAGDKLPAPVRGAVSGPGHHRLPGLVHEEYCDVGSSAAGTTSRS